METLGSLEPTRSSWDSIGLSLHYLMKQANLLCLSRWRGLKLMGLREP